MKSLSDAIKQATPEKTHRGMTLREYAAIAAMQGLLSNDGAIAYESCAIVAVKFADALIAKLEESNNA